MELDGEVSDEVIAHGAELAAHLVGETLSAAWSVPPSGSKRVDRVVATARAAFGALELHRPDQVFVGGPAAGRVLRSRRHGAAVLGILEQQLVVVTLLPATCSAAGLSGCHRYRCTASSRCRRAPSWWLRCRSTVRTSARSASSGRPAMDYRGDGRDRARCGRAPRRAIRWRSRWPALRRYTICTRCSGCADASDDEIKKAFPGARAASRHQPRQPRGRSAFQGGLRRLRGPARPRAPRPVRPLRPRRRLRGAVLGGFGFEGDLVRGVLRAGRGHRGARGSRLRRGGPSRAELRRGRLRVPQGRHRRLPTTCAPAGEGRLGHRGRQVRRLPGCTLLGQVVTSVSCARCSGTGDMIPHPCPEWRGTVSAGVDPHRRGPARRRRRSHLPPRRRPGGAGQRAACRALALRRTPSPWHPTASSDRATDYRHRPWPSAPPRPRSVPRRRWSPSTTPTSHLAAGTHARPCRAAPRPGCPTCAGVGAATSSSTWSSRSRRR